MRLRSLAPLAAVTAGAAALAVVPALAADREMRVTDFAFTPASVTVNVGDTVTWRREEGFHNVHFEDTTPEPAAPDDGWQTVDRTFTNEGTYRYVCDAHAEMKGTVVVEKAAATPTPTPTASPTPTPSPGASPTPTPSPSPSPGPADPQPPVGILPLKYTVKPTAKRFCVRDCKRPGVFVRIDHEAGETLTFRGVLRRGKARFGTVRLSVPRGGRRVRILKTRSGKRLRPGRYVLRLEPAGGGSVRKVRFHVIR